MCVRLHLIDFEQLKIENQTVNEKIEERNEELLKLRKKNTTTVQVRTRTIIAYSQGVDVIAFKSKVCNHCLVCSPHCTAAIIQRKSDVSKFRIRLFPRFFDCLRRS